jgi:hypothetical protein
MTTRAIATRSLAAAARGGAGIALVTLLILILAPGCATLGDPPGPVGTLVVENDNPMQVNIFAARNGMRIRVGTVTGVSTQEFDLRQDMLTGAGELRLLIEPVGSTRTYPATPITVRQGDVIELRVSSVIR